MTEEDFDINQPAETIIDIDAPNYRQIITAIFAGNYSWACILFLHLLDCIPTKYIPPQIYLKLLEDNFIPHISKQNQADKFNK